MSGEIHKDFADKYLTARNEVERIINTEWTNQNFGPGLDKWALIAIILPAGWGDDLPEVSKYHRKRRVVEFRLVIDFESFKGADDDAQKGLLCEMLLRSIDRMGEMRIPELDLGRLRSEVRRVAEGQGWLGRIGETSG